MSLKELRSHKFLGMAIFDLVTTIIGTVIIFLICWKVHFSNLEWWKFAIAGAFLAIPIGIVFHVIFGTNTHLNYTLGLSYKPS